MFQRFINKDREENSGAECAIRNESRNFTPEEGKSMKLSSYQVVSGDDGNVYLFVTAPSQNLESDGVELYGASRYKSASDSEHCGWGELMQITDYGQVIDEAAIAVGADHGAVILANMFEQKVIMTGDRGGVDYSGYKLMELDCAPESSLEISEAPALGDGYDHALTLDLKAHPFDNVKNLLYFTDDYDVVTVDDDGVVTALAPGEAMISVMELSGYEHLPICHIWVNVEKAQGVDEDPEEKTDKRADVKPAPVRYPVIQSLSENRLSFDSVSSNDTLYLAKGGKYTIEAGLEPTGYDKKAIRISKKNRLTAKKGSTPLTITKDGVSKTITVRVVKVKKKKAVLSAAGPSISLNAVFTGAEELMPDVSDGSYSVTLQDKKNAFTLVPGSVKADASAGNSLAQFSISANGIKGSAKVTAVFGGKKYRASVRYK